MTNKRIKEISEGVFHEALADSLKVSWNPIEETANINFVGSTYLRMGDAYVSRVSSDSTLSMTRDALLAESFEIAGKTVTGQDVDMFIRLLFDKLYNAPENADQLEPDPT